MYYLPMKKPLNYTLIGFFATLILLILIDISFQHFSINSDGYISNGIIGNILSFDMTSSESAWHITLGGFILAMLLINDFLAHKTYKLHGNEKVVGTGIGVILAASILLFPWFQPYSYENLLGGIIIFVTLLIVRRKLLQDHR